MTSPVQNIWHRELTQISLFLQQVNCVDESLQRSPRNIFGRLVRRPQHDKLTVKHFWNWKCNNTWLELRRGSDEWTHSSNSTFGRTSMQKWVTEVLFWYSLNLSLEYQKTALTNKKRTDNNTIPSDYHQMCVSPRLYSSTGKLVQSG